MTREEAIFYIKELQKTYAHMDKKVAEAVNMAIEALQAKTDGGLISKSAVMETIGYWTTTEEWGNCFIPSKLVEMIDALPSDYTQTSGDFISRADAIEAIESRQTEQWIDADVDYNNGLESAVAEIKALPSADRPSGEWIPCSERLPDNPKDVLTTLSNGMVCIGRHHSFGKWTFEAASIMVAFPEEAVIAWMPLPEPYKGGEEE